MNEKILLKILNLIIKFFQSDFPSNLQNVIRRVDVGIVVLVPQYSLAIAQRSRGKHQMVALMKVVS